MSAERLALALWGEDAPAGAVKTVQVHVSRLRKALGDPGWSRRRRRATGCASAPASSTRSASRAGSWRAACAGRGAAGGGGGGAAGGAGVLAWPAAGGPGVRAVRAGGDRAARGAASRRAEARVEADLAAGRHARLSASCGSWRLSIRRASGSPAQLDACALSQRAAGRGAGGLSRGAARLVETPGVEPGPELQRLHERVLEQDPSLELAPPRRSAAELDAADAPPLVGRGASWSGCGRTGRRRGRGGSARRGRGPAGMVRRGWRPSWRARCTGRAPRSGTPSGTRPPGRRARRPRASAADGGAADAARARRRRPRRRRRAGGARAAWRRPGSRTCSALVLARSGRDGGRRMTRSRSGRSTPPRCSRSRAGRSAQDAPVEELLAASGGVPRRVHEVVGRWARREAERRVGSAAGRTAAGRPSCARWRPSWRAAWSRCRRPQERAATGTTARAGACARSRGSPSFDVADAPYFFGRERLVAELVARLVGAPLLGVVGPSGSGKSSVVRAGLLPALAGGVLPGSDGWTQVVMRPGEHPLRELARAPRRGAGGARRCSWSISSRRRSRPAVTRPSARAFVAELTAAARRADRRAGVARRPLRALRRLSGAAALLARASRAGRGDAARRAAARGRAPGAAGRAAGRARLAEALVADVEHEPGALPMLSTALLELWQRRDGRRLRLATYEATGGVRGAVARHAEGAFGRLDAAQQDVARGVLLRLATEDGAGGVSSAGASPLAELAERDADVARVVELLDRPAPADRERRRGRARARGAPARVAAPARLAGGGRATAAACTATSPTPRASGTSAAREPGDLYRGARLAAALEWRAGTSRSSTAPSRRSWRPRTPSAHAAQTRRRRLLRRSASALLVIVTGISTVLAVRGIQRARFEERAAAVTQPRHAAPPHSSARPPRSPPCSGSRPTAASRPWRRAAPCSPSCRRWAAPGSLGPPLEPRRAGSGRGVQPGRAARWPAPPTTGRSGCGTSPPAGASARPLAGHAGEVRDLAFSADGTLLASAGEDGTVRLWDLRARRPVGRPLEVPTGS